jgi:hypothetical protein
MTTRSAQKWLFLAASLLATAACGSADVAQSEQHHSEQANLVEGSPESVGVLRFLHDPNTTFVLLDEGVPLDRRAAKNLIAHRNGPDGLFATADDDLFDDLNELLSVPQVGPKRLAKIAAYAEKAGFVPSGDDLLGSYDNVSFSVDEAAAVLLLANSASLQTLDVDAQLDKRAAKSIVADRPHASVLQLSQSYYVGYSALRKLKDYAHSGQAGYGEACQSKTECSGSLYCNNIAYDAEPLVGRCADPTIAPATLGSSCQEKLPCEQGLVCAGTTLYGGQGFCQPAHAIAMRNESVGKTIPSGGSISHSLHINNLLSVPEDVVIELDIAHPRKQDLIVTLTAASNTSATLWDRQQDPPNYVYETWGIERDNEVNGTWTLHIEDKGQGAPGTLIGFVLTVTSRYD